MPNLLTGKPFAVDSLFAARTSGSFKGTSDNLAWNTRRGGLVLVPPFKGAGSRSKEIRGTFVSEVVEAEFPFEEMLPSWNLQLDEKVQGYWVELRVSADGEKWSPWFYFGSGGTAVARKGKRVAKAPAWGEVYIDYLMLKKPAKFFQYCVGLESEREALANPATRPVLRRFFVSYSNVEGDEELYRSRANGAKPPRLRKDFLIPMPYRSQRTVSEKSLRHQICCPTCVSMILEANGVHKETLEVAAEALCHETKIYGVWPRAVQTAANNGMEAWVDRFRGHAQVKTVLASGQPVMASIRVNKGDWKHKGYGTSGGHLILLRGIRSNGDYIVNDPYATGPGGAEIDYSEADLEKVWLEKGGVGILIRKPEGAASR